MMSSNFSLTVTLITNLFPFFFHLGPSSDRKMMVRNLELKKLTMLQKYLLNMYRYIAKPVACLFLVLSKLQRITIKISGVAYAISGANCRIMTIKVLLLLHGQFSVALWQLTTQLNMLMNKWGQSIWNSSYWHMKSCDVFQLWWHQFNIAVVGFL